VLISRSASVELTDLLFVLHLQSSTPGILVIRQSATPRHLILNNEQPVVSVRTGQRYALQMYA